jgi:hypothetical protein
MQPTCARSLGALFVGLTALLIAGAAQAVAFGGFTCITNNDAGNCAIGESQLSADLTGDVLTITMSGSNPAVVEQVFIDAPGVTGGIFVGGVGVVDFGNAVAGGNLPGGNPVGFTSVVNFAADNPAPRNGIGYHSQDTLVLQVGGFQLTGDLSDIRVGVHVIGFEDGGSEAFTTPGPGTAVPEPSAALIFGIGTLVMGGRIRSRR